MKLAYEKNIYFRSTQPRHIYFPLIFVWCAVGKKIREMKCQKYVYYCLAQVLNCGLRERCGIIEIYKFG